MLPLASLSEVSGGPLLLASCHMPDVLELCDQPGWLERCYLLVLSCLHI